MIQLVVSMKVPRTVVKISIAGITVDPFDGCWSISLISDVNLVERLGSFEAQSFAHYFGSCEIEVPITK